jgi:hypothetical protein
MLDKIILLSGIILYSITYVFGSYYFRLGILNKESFLYIFLVSIIIGLVSFSIKIPIFYFYATNMNIIILHVITTSIIFITAILYSYFILNENIPLHTYIIVCSIILLIILNNWLDFRAGKVKK